jgi:spoIIIJ-associated protein
VKDAVFSGASLEAALAVASRDLGVPAGELRYVVLEQSDTVARVAVLLEASRSRPAAPAGDPALEIPRLVSAYADAAGLEVGVEVTGEEGAWTANLHGADLPFFLEDGGRVLRALELVMQCALARGGRRIRITAEGYREVRDAEIRHMTLELVEAALADGKPRTTPPLNSYERRLVHLVAEEHGSVRTESEGEEGERRVRIRPA